jgi:hypothetical protein
MTSIVGFSKNPRYKPPDPDGYNVEPIGLDMSGQSGWTCRVKGISATTVVAGCSTSRAREAGGRLC